MGGKHVRLTRARCAGYEQEEEGAAGKPAQSAAGHISTSAASFRDFLLKPEILRAINDCAFEHPSKGTVPEETRRPMTGRPYQVRSLAHACGLAAHPEAALLPIALRGTERGRTRVAPT